VRAPRRLCAGGSCNAAEQRARHAGQGVPTAAPKRSTTPAAPPRPTKQSARQSRHADGGADRQVPDPTGRLQYRVTLSDMSSATALWVSAPTEMWSTPASA